MNQEIDRSPATSESSPSITPKSIIAKLTSSKIFNSEIIVNPFIRQYLLMGYAAKGVIYFLIGVLAIEAAILPESKAAGTYSALKHLSTQPLGSILLCLLAISLTGYVWRRLLQAVIYPGKSQRLSPKAWLQRIGYIMSSLSYAGVVYSALDIVFQLGEYNHTAKSMVKDLFEQPVGEWIVFFIGIGVCLVGIGYVYGAYTGSYVGEFVSFNSRFQSFIELLAKIGIATRGIAFVVTGIFLMEASILSDADLAGGLQNAFQILGKQSLGWLWLWLIGSGFIAYGIYMFVAAKYRRYVIR